MGHQEEAEELPPHVLVLPYPELGHVNSMLKLSELLCLGGLHVTLLLTENIHGRLLRHSSVRTHFSRYSGFRFHAIPDGLPEDHPRSADRIGELAAAFSANLKPLLRGVLVSSQQSSNDKRRKSVTCIIVDWVLLNLALDVAEDIGIPSICFCTSSTTDLLAYICVPKLIESGEIPFAGNDLDEPVASVPGMESFLRRRDLPSFFRYKDLEKGGLPRLSNASRQMPRARALILNTFEDLEGPILDHTRSQSQCPKIYAIGPLHAQLKNRLKEPIHSNSIWEEDKSCIAWLDSQPRRSVIYVSFGSVSLITKEQLMEFWHGLVNSGKRFLWVIRPDSMAAGKDGDEREIPAELLESTKERGYIVEWAPQIEILAHRAIGGFLTHSGWNSILESIVEGVPMICWPYFGDQQINSRFVGEVWKIGLDMKDTCDRSVIEKMVRDLMDVRGEEFRKPADRMAKLAEKTISEGGSSYCNLEELIADIRLMMSNQPRS